MQPVPEPLRGSLRPPGSKSITNRALVCAALAQGRSVLTGALQSEDTEVMIESLRRLRIGIEAAAGGTRLEVEGCSGVIPAMAADLFVAGSGTSMRFLTAVATLGRGRYRLAGIERMHQRPIQDLFDALRALGANAESENNDGCPPVIVQADGLRGGQATIAGDISSQFLSGLLMAAPYAEQPVRLDVAGNLVSKPYVRMTLAVMKSFGVEVETDPQLAHFDVPALTGYRARDYEIEPDASAASYFFAAAAITGGRVTVEGLSRDSLQGDIGICECLSRMGCDIIYEPDAITVQGGPLRGITADMNAISDTVQTLAAVALFAQGPTTIRGVAHIRLKESDRIGDLARELNKLGARVQEHADGLTIQPGTLQGASIETYNDHRMAMSLALVGLRVPGVVILDPDCTSKTYPGYFADLEQLAAASR